MVHLILESDFMRNTLFTMTLLSNIYGYNPKYEDLTDEEKYYMNYVDECLSNNEEKFSNACLKSMLFILDAANRMNTEEEYSDEEIKLNKEKILLNFSEEDKEKLELFMYACIQTMGIYSNKEENNELGISYRLM